MKVLDCTFRDGGYYNQWDFDLDLARKYLHAIHQAKIDAIEIGFRFTSKNSFMGPFAYSSDNFLRDLDLPPVPIGVMVNGSDVEHVSAEEMFNSAAESPVDRVRLALHFPNTKMLKCGPFAKGLKTLGYGVGVNMMQTGGKSHFEIQEAIKVIQEWGVADVIYFADSLGNMGPNDVVRTIESIRSVWSGSIGFHGHDNKGQGLVNSLKAKSEGVDWIDSTVLGMGRGAGNTRTEFLLMELKNKGFDYEPENIFELVAEDFEPMQKQFGWGPSLYYYLAATFNSHPTYVQEMVKRCHSAKEILDAIKRLKNHDSYIKEKLKEKGYSGAWTIGKWSASNWIKGREVLIVASGPGSKRHLNAIIKYVETKKPFVVCLNCDTGFPNPLVDIYAVCDKIRLETEGQKYEQLKKKVLAPESLVELAFTFAKLDTLDYGLHVQDKTWKSEEKRCIIPTLMVAPYAFAACVAGGARRILLAGFDGYGIDEKQAAMMEVFDLYEGPPIVAVTPSSYNVTHSSIYAPEFSGD